MKNTAALAAQSATFKVCGRGFPIPAGVPHQAIVTSGTLMYLAIKTPKQ
jgi:hypothetical protein